VRGYATTIRTDLLVVVFCHRASNLPVELEDARHKRRINALSFHPRNSAAKEYGGLYGAPWSTMSGSQQESAHWFETRLAGFFTLVEHYGESVGAKVGSKVASNGGPNVDSKVVSRVRDSVVGAKERALVGLSRRPPNGASDRTSDGASFGRSTTRSIRRYISRSVSQTTRRP